MRLRFWRWLHEYALRHRNALEPEAWYVLRLSDGRHFYTGRKAREIAQAAMHEAVR